MTPFQKKCIEDRICLIDTNTYELFKQFWKGEKEKEAKKEYERQISELMFADRNIKPFVRERILKR
jgi:hypothetical protein